MWRLVVKLGYTYPVIIIFFIWCWAGYENCLIYTHGDIVYATLIEEPYISRKDCRTVLQYQEVTEVHRLGTWGICKEKRYKKGSTIPVKYLKGVTGFKPLSSIECWFGLPTVLLCLYFLYFTIKEHIKFFREEREKKQNAT